MNFLTRLRGIEELQAEAESKTMKLLRDSGWTYSSSYPDCYWRWSKTINEQIITTTSVSEALRLEERMAECGEDCRLDD